MDQDWLWVQKFIGGEALYFGKLFEKHKKAVLNLAFRFLRDQGAAEDTAQDVFLKLYEKKVRVDPRAKFYTWLYRVTVNACLDVLRAKRFRLRSLDDAAGDPSGRGTPLKDLIADPHAPVPGSDLEALEIRRAVDEAVEALPEHLRTVMLMYQFQEMPYREIAAILNISEKAVERRLYHAKEILRKSLGQKRI